MLLLKSHIVFWKFYLENNPSVYPQIIDDSIFVPMKGNSKKCTSLFTYAPNNNQPISVQVTTFILVAYYSTLGTVKKKNYTDFDLSIERCYKCFKDLPHEFDTEVAKTQQILMCFCLSQLPAECHCFFSLYSRRKLTC